MSIIERAIQAARTRAPAIPAEPAPTTTTGTPRTPAQARPVHATPRESVVFPHMGNGGSLITGGADRKIHDQFRRLKRPLLQCAFGPLAHAPDTQIIMITSPLQGAGKTFVSSNLAHVLAMEKDRNVLLIDTDNANPTLTRQLGLTGRPGLYDLIGSPDMLPEQVICGTDIPGLWVLPAGSAATDSLELLNSSRCRDVLHAIMSRDPNGIVILDAPPLLITNEAPAVTALAGQFLLVVESGATPRSSITRSLELLDEKKPIGLVLNKARGKGELSSYYPTYPYPAS